MKKVIALAHSFHNGLNVYRSKHACMSVLREVEQIQPPWWTPRCSAFLRLVERTKTIECDNTPVCEVHKNVKHKIPVIVLQGLDGTGKSSVARQLANRLHGVMLPTPDPQWSDVRQAFRSIPLQQINQDNVSEVFGRAFYSAANYIAADVIMSLRERDFGNSSDNTQPNVVIMDRWWCSTCAMALAHHVMKHYYNDNNKKFQQQLNQQNQQQIASLLPPMHSQMYKWPLDLLSFQCGFLLQVDESVRIERILQRAPADSEETLLAQQACMRFAVTHVFHNMKLPQSINVHTSREAVNIILSKLPSLGVCHNATPFTARQLQEMQPC